MDTWHLMPNVHLNNYELWIMYRSSTLITAKQLKFLCSYWYWSCLGAIILEQQWWLTICTYGTRVSIACTCASNNGPRANWQILQIIVWSESYAKLVLRERIHRDCMSEIFFNPLGSLLSTAYCDRRRGTSMSSIVRIQRTEGGKQ